MFSLYLYSLDQQRKLMLCFTLNEQILHREYNHSMHFHQCTSLQLKYRQIFTEILREYIQVKREHLLVETRFFFIEGLVMVSLENK